MLVGIRVSYTQSQYTKLSREGIVMHAMHERLAGSSERADWRAEWQRSDNTGRMAGMQCSQELWQANSQALIPLVGNNSLFNLLHSQMHIFIHYNEVVENQPFHLPIYSYSYLLFIYNNHDGLF